MSEAEPKRKATGEASNGDSDVPIAKKSKADKDLGVWQQSWEHYRSYLESSEEDADGDTGEANHGDFDELFELIDILKDSVPRPSKMDGSLLDCLGTGATTNEISAKCRTIEGLLPVLLSMSYLHIGSHAISMAFAERGDEENSTFSKSPDEYLTTSLQYFPYNAAAASMLANYYRMNMLASVQEICDLYVLAANNASKIRMAAISMLEDDAVPEEAKEWIELLLLNDIAGSEFVGGDEEDDEGGEDKEVNTRDFDSKAEEEDEVTESEVEGTASFMVALLLSVLGKHNEALAYLKKFGVTHRIHPNVWRGAKIANKSYSEQIVGSPVPLPAAFRPIKGQGNNAILPAKLYKGLCNAFCPSSVYWKESDYDNRGYYSYFLDLTEEMKKSPKNIIEDVIVNHLLPLAKRGLSIEDGEKIVGAEWWTHHRPIQANLGHQLHFDTDEALLAQEQSITHPILSSVLYLTGGAKPDTDTKKVASPAGSTIVFDQTPEAKEVAPKVWTSEPRNNSFMIFPGDRLHGVLPCPGDDNQSNADGSEPEHRLTFMVGWWTCRVPDKMKERRLYGPCGPLPPPNNDHTWVRNISTGYDKDNEGVSGTQNIDQAAIGSFALPEISPAWESLEVDNGKDKDGGYFGIPRGLDHRFFVKNAPHCFHDSLMNKDECF